MQGKDDTGALQPGGLAVLALPGLAADAEQNDCTEGGGH